MVSEQPERFFVAELIREKIFLLYSQEVPYSTQVRNGQGQGGWDGQVIGALVAAL